MAVSGGGFLAGDLRSWKARAVPRVATSPSLSSQSFSSGRPSGYGRQRIRDVGLG